VSLLETPMTLRYWEEVGGTLVEEFCVVPQGPGHSRRLVDAVILPRREYRRAARGEKVNLTGQDVIVVQTKSHRLGMYLLGQALFSRILLEERFSPRSVRSVALCSVDDSVLRPLAERFGVEVVVDQGAAVSTTGRPGRSKRI
jgi:hypothetical protein